MGRRSSAIALLAGLWIAPQAWGAEYYLEGPAIAAKADVNQMRESASEAGINSRVVRRYLDSQGWRYLVVAEGYADQSSATNAANTLAAAIGGRVVVYTADGDESRQVAVVEVRSPVAQPPPPPPTDAQAAAILARAIAAHGGPEGGGDVARAAGTVVFEYVRSLAGGPRVRHVYVRRGVDQDLQVKILSGEGVDSDIRLVQGTAWLSTEKGAFSPQDPERTSEVLAQASPGGIFPLILTFADASAQRGEFDNLSVHGTSEVDGEECDVLQFPGDRSSGPMSLEISRSSGLVRRVSFEGGDLVHQFDDYAPVATGLIIPRRVRTWKEGALVETDEVTSLALDGAVPDGALTLPAAP